MQRTFVLLLLAWSWFGVCFAGDRARTTEPLIPTTLGAGPAKPLASADTSLPHRFGHAMAYDSARGRVVLIEGYTFNGTWEWDGSVWVNKTPASGSPPPRAGHAMAYDSVRGRVVLFGGKSKAGVYLGDTWEWDGTAWVDRTPVTGGPRGRAFHAMAYDSARGRVVLFGGRWADESYPAPTDTWEWDGKVWVASSPVHSASPRSGHAMAYDSALDRVVLFGGIDPGGHLMGDTWEWDGSDWIALAPAVSPTARGSHKMVYDSLRERVVLVGGTDASTPAAPPRDTWEWDGSSWVDKTPAVGSPNPEAWFGDAMAYDSRRGRAVLVGARQEGIWEWDGTRWTERTPGNNPRTN